MQHIAGILCFVVVFFNDVDAIYSFKKRLNILTVLLFKAGAIYIAPPPAYQLSRTQTESIQEPHQWFPE